ncbi:MAG: hypothetical protein ACFFBD_24550, partial [Candidatus Hodarchaeota archaeon]
SNLSPYYGLQTKFYEAEGKIFIVMIFEKSTESCNELNFPISKNLKKESQCYSNCRFNYLF